MNAHTHEFLIRWQHDYAVMHKAAADRVPPRWLGHIDRNGSPWPAIAQALRTMEAVGRDAPGHDAPPLFAERHRLAWLNLLRAAAAADGDGDNDAPRWAHMNSAELSDELSDLLACRA